MVYKTLDAVNTTQGIHMVFIYVNDITGGLFSRLFLLTFFMALAIGSYLTQKRISGNSDLPASFAIGSFVTSGASIIMSFVPGLINRYDIIVVFTVTIGSVFWLYLSKKTESV